MMISSSSSSSSFIAVSLPRVDFFPTASLIETDLVAVVGGFLLFSLAAVVVMMGCVGIVVEAVVVDCALLEALALLVVADSG